MRFVTTPAATPVARLQPRPLPMTFSPLQLESQRVASCPQSICSPCPPPPQLLTGYRAPETFTFRGGGLEPLFQPPAPWRGLQGAGCLFSIFFRRISNHWFLISHSTTAVPLVGAIRSLLRPRLPNLQRRRRRLHTPVPTCRTGGEQTAARGNRWLDGPVGASSHALRSDWSRTGMHPSPRGVPGPGLVKKKWGGGGLEHPQIWGGVRVAERGSKGHKLMSSMQMPEILPRTQWMGLGLKPKWLQALMRWSRRMDYTVNGGGGTGTISAAAAILQKWGSRCFETEGRALPNMRHAQALWPHGGSSCKAQGGSPCPSL